MDIQTTIQALYSSEIPCRLEWMYDDSFTWSIQDQDKFPRLVSDTMNKELTTKTCDWLVRRNSESFPKAVEDLARSAAELYPQSHFALIYKASRN